MAKKIGKNQNDNPKPYKVPKSEYVGCPACGEKIVFESIKETIQRIFPFEKNVDLENSEETVQRRIPCNPKLRLVIFALLYIDIKKIPHDQFIKGIEIGTGRCVFGRVANHKEKKYFKEHKTLNGLVPWAMARVSHFETCTGWRKWLNGTVKNSKPESDDSISTETGG